jgi:hypothetical protein
MGKKVTYNVGVCKQCGERGFLVHWGAWLVCRLCRVELERAAAARRRPL